MTFQNATERVFLVVFMVIIVILMIVVHKASKREYELLAENSAKSEQIIKLNQALEEQNEAIELMNQQYQIAVDRYASAVTVAQRKNAKLTTTVDRLQTADGETCKDAMRLIDILLFDC